MIGPLVFAIVLVGMSVLACSAPSDSLVCRQDVAGDYQGTVFNETVSRESNIQLEVEQSGCFIQGNLRVTLPLVGSGPIYGSVTSDQLEFTVYSNIAGDYLEMIFTGRVNESGDLKGNYQVPATQISAIEQFGSWEVVRANPG